MSVLGLVVEYNPFHNGHSYHLEQARKLTGAELSVCVMSGNFIQRGEPALVNKWARTKAAILSGIDLVIELPVVYSMASAEFFAFGAVKILDSLGLVDYICFGSENGTMGQFESIADILLQEPPLYKNILKEYLFKGYSFPSSREFALRQYLNETGTNTDNLDQIISTSNNILGVEYIKALKRLNSKIKPFTIKRINNTYNCHELTGSISSATAVRKSISENIEGDSNCNLAQTLPSHSLSVLNEEFRCKRGPVFPVRYEDLILSFLRKMPLEKIADAPYVGEGLENRLKRAANDSGSLDELIEKACTRRYTRTRIQRILFSILIGLSADDFRQFNSYGGPQYIRVLGFNKKGRDLLSAAKAKATLPIIVKTADYKKTCNPFT
jgi:predicted nucleotidyltransferase